MADGLIRSAESRLPTSYRSAVRFPFREYSYRLEWSRGESFFKLSEQTGAIYASSRAAEKSADATLLSTRAVMNAERAWIVISVESPAPGQFTFTATNAGRTPALVRSLWLRQSPPDGRISPLGVSDHEVETLRARLFEL